MAKAPKALSRPLRPILCLAIVLLSGGASVWAQQSVPIFPEDRERGIRLYNQGDHKGAITALRAAVKRNKDDGEAWHYLGLALVRVDDMKNARKAFETAVKLQPGLGPAHTGFAYTLMATGRNEDAEREANRAIELNRADALAHYVLGVVELRTWQNVKARAEAEIAITQRPEFAPPYLLKCQALLALEGDEAARFSKIIRVRGNQPLSEEEREQQAQHLQKTLDLYAAAAEALQAYLKLAASDRATAIWRDQLETLQVFAGARGHSAPPVLFAVWEVTTRVRVLSKPEPTYTAEARSSGIEGTVILRAVFSSAGTVEHILVLRSLPSGLTEKSIEAAKKIRFIPATKDGRFVSIILELQYNFNLY